MESGLQLLEIREKHGLTVREVYQYSKVIAEAKQSKEFLVSAGWLSQIEKKGRTPGIHKLFSLSVIYRLNFINLLLLFGIDLDEIGEYQLTTPQTKTHLADVTVYNEARSIDCPISRSLHPNIDETGLISRIGEMWAEIPLAFLRALKHEPFIMYGFIGLKDRMMYPLLRPGSLVQIDNRQTKIPKSPWRSIHERPIYFVDLNGGYACSWCELQTAELLLLPHPESECSIRKYAYPDEARILGRITGVAMEIASKETAPRSRQLPMTKL